MNDPDAIDAILDRFRQWLDDARAQTDLHGRFEPGSNSDENSAARDFGIIDLVEEFTALRQELKLQTKSGRGLLDQTESTLSALRQAIEQVRSVEPKEAHAVWTAGKALALALADLDEAVERGYAEIERARRQIAEESVRALEAALNDLHRRRFWLVRRLLRSDHNQVLDVVKRDGAARHELFESFLEGYGLIQRGLRRALASEQVARITCEGQPVNPELMTVIELVEPPDQPPGTVAKELRRGYTWRGRVIRYAEVQAVRSAARASHSSNGTALPDQEIDDLEVHPGAELEGARLDSE